MQIDGNFDIPYRQLDKIFDVYKIKSELVCQTLLGNQLDIPLFVNSKTNDKMLIGFFAYCFQTEAQWFQAVAPEFANFFLIKGNAEGGRAIFPNNMGTNILPAAVTFPYNQSARIYINGCYVSAAGEYSTIDNCLKVRLDEIIEGSEELHIVIDSAAANVPVFVLYTIFAEGRLKPK